MSNDLRLRDRLFRSILVAVVGAFVGLLFMLSIDFWKRPYASNSLLLEATVIGGVLGAVLGFVLSDSDWLDWIGGR